MQGDQGVAGPTGPQGEQGIAGPTGPMGPQGDAGQNGINGANGPTGPSGSDGIDGVDGAQGPTGPTGPYGVGPTGPTGPAGTDGVQGPTGPQGPMGPPGGGGGGSSYTIYNNVNGPGASAWLGVTDANPASIAPFNSVGSDGDFYLGRIDVVGPHQGALYLFGPKNNGAWPTPGSLINGVGGGGGTQYWDPYGSLDGLPQSTGGIVYNNQPGNDVVITAGTLYSGKSPGYYTENWVVQAEAATPANIYSAIGLERLNYIYPNFEEITAGMAPAGFLPQQASYVMGVNQFDLNGNPVEAFITLINMESGADVITTAQGTFTGSNTKINLVQTATRDVYQFDDWGRLYGNSGSVDPTADTNFIYTLQGNSHINITTPGSFDEGSKIVFLFKGNGEFTVKYLTSSQQNFINSGIVLGAATLNNNFTANIPGGSFTLNIPDIAGITWAVGGYGQLKLRHFSGHEPLEIVDVKTIELSAGSGGSLDFTGQKIVVLSSAGDTAYGDGNANNRFPALTVYGVDANGLPIETPLWQKIYHVQNDTAPTLYGVNDICRKFVLDRNNNCIWVAFTPHTKLAPTTLCLMQVNLTTGAVMTVRRLTCSDLPGGYFGYEHFDLVKASQTSGTFCLVVTYSKLDDNNSSSYTTSVVKLNYQGNIEWQTNLATGTQFTIDYTIDSSTGNSFSHPNEITTGVAFPSQHLDATYDFNDNCLYVLSAFDGFNWNNTNSMVFITRIDGSTGLSRTSIPESVGLELDKSSRTKPVSFYDQIGAACISFENNRPSVWLSMTTTDYDENADTIVIQQFNLYNNNSSLYRVNRDVILNDSKTYVHKTSNVNLTPEVWSGYGRGGIEANTATRGRFAISYTQGNFSMLPTGIRARIMHAMPFNVEAAGPITFLDDSTISVNPQSDSVWSDVSYTAVLIPTSTSSFTIQ